MLRLMGLHGVVDGLQSEQGHAGGGRGATAGGDYGGEKQQQEVDEEDVGVAYAVLHRISTHRRATGPVESHSLGVEDAGLEVGAAQGQGRMAAAAACPSPLASASSNANAAAANANNTVVVGSTSLYAPVNPALLSSSNNNSAAFVRTLEHSAHSMDVVPMTLAAAGASTHLPLASTPASAGTASARSPTPAALQQQQAGLTPALASGDYSGSAFPAALGPAAAAHLSPAPTGRAGSKAPSLRGSVCSEVCCGVCLDSGVRFARLKACKHELCGECVEYCAKLWAVFTC